METLKPGLPVFSIEDRRVGVVQAVNSCCFEVHSENARAFVSPEAIYNIDGLRVVLICEKPWIHRYNCRYHSAAAGGA